MGSYWSSGDREGAPATAAANDIASSQQLCADLERRLEHTAAAAARCRAEAAACVRHDRARALFHLKRARIHEAGQPALQAEIMNMHRVILSMEQAVLNLETVEGMRGAERALGATAVDADRAADAMDAVAEQVQLQGELSDSLGARCVDDDAEQAALAELHALCEPPPAAAGEHLCDAGAEAGDPGEPPDDFALQLPLPPTHALPRPAAPAPAADMRALEAAMLQ